jgi:hypothetical protein
MVSAAPSWILMLAGIGFIGFGVAYAAWPTRMAGLTDLAPTSPTALADFTATYGGFQIGFGIFLLACTRDDRWVEPGLWAVIASLAGFAVLRGLVMLLHGGRVRRSVWFGLGLELAGLALSTWALAQVR